MAHDPQIPSRQDRRKASVLSISFLILIRASSVIGPHLDAARGGVSAPPLGFRGVAGQARGSPHTTHTHALCRLRGSSRGGVIYAARGMKHGGAEQAGGTHSLRSISYSCVYGLPFVSGSCATQPVQHVDTRQPRLARGGAECEPRRRKRVAVGHPRPSGRLASLGVGPRRPGRTRRSDAGVPPPTQARARGVTLRPEV